MTLNIFANINQTIDLDVASTVCANHGFVVEKERREKGAAVQKVEKVPIPIAASTRVMEEAAIITTLEEVKPLRFA
jgi:translation initiation factor IF-2